MRVGNLYATKSVKKSIDKNSLFRDEVNKALSKFMNNDWGDTCPEDALLNNLALETCERIIAVYITCCGPIWIISENDRLSTTILFPSEY